MDYETSFKISEGLVKFGDQLIHLSLELRKLPRLVFLLKLLASSNHAEQKTKIHALLGGRKSALASLNLHVVEINELLYLETHGVADISLHGFGFCVDVGDHDDVFVGDFPEGLLFLLDDLVGVHLNIVVIGKSPALVHPLTLSYKESLFKYFLNCRYVRTGKHPRATTQRFLLSPINHGHHHYGHQVPGRRHRLRRLQYAFTYSGTSAGGTYTVDRVADKIDYVHEHIVALRSGLAGQSQQTVHKVRHLIESHVNEQGKLPHVKTAARMLQKANYEKGLETGYIIAGWDPYNGPQVYSVNLGGATLLRNYALGGSGSGFIYGYVDANYREGMSFEEAKAFCINTVSLAMRRDGSSGGIIRLSNITERGLEKEYHTYESLPYKST